jgi:predicted dehydrogenase
MHHLHHVNFGFIGAGQIAYPASNSIRKHEHASVKAVHDLNPERLAKLCHKTGASPVSDLDDLLADDSIDAVYIATPNKFHAPLAIQSLAAGKHVILEKPFAMNLAEAEEVVATAKKHDRAFMLGMNHRFNANCQIIKAHVQAGTLGEIYHAKATWRMRSYIPKLGTWFGSRELAGGGCLYDIGVHVLDLGLYLMDNFEPVSTTAVRYTKFGQRGLGSSGTGMSEATGIPFDVDDFASALIKFSNGSSMTLDTAWACHQEPENLMDVALFGTDAGASTLPARLFRQGTSEPSTYEIIDPAKNNLAMPHCDRFYHFIDHLTTGEPLVVTTDQALIVQKIMDAISRSCDSGKEVILPSSA